jgi:hypothetical protein
MLRPEFSGKNISTTIKISSSAVSPKDRTGAAGRGNDDNYAQNLTSFAWSGEKGRGYRSKFELPYVSA